MKFHCVGCGSPIPWDGHGIFSYTCRCGGRIFINDESGIPAVPLTVLRGMAAGFPMPHLDDLVGNSEYTSSEKEGMISELRSRGSIWMEECEQCQQDGSLEKHKRRLALNKALDEAAARSALGELNSEEAVAEMTAIYKRFADEDRKKETPTKE